MRGLVADPGQRLVDPAQPADWAGPQPGFEGLPLGVGDGEQPPPGLPDGVGLLAHLGPEAGALHG